MKAVLGGGSGFIGRHLKTHLEGRGYEVVVLARKATREHEVEWDGKTLGPWVAAFEGANMAINLAGKSIASRMTDENKREMRDSRIDSTLAFGSAILKCERPPDVWVNSSAIGFYGDRGQETLTESSTAGTDFLAELCVDWESAVTHFETPKTRKALIRTGFVLGSDGGALPMMTTAVKAFVGGTLGDGQQWIPWIHIEDLVNMFRWVGEEGGEGAYNGCNPNPTQNEDFMKQLRHVLHRPWAPPAPGWALEAAKVLSPTDPTLALISDRALPDRALREGFVFAYSDLELALRNLMA